MAGTRHPMLFGDASISARIARVPVVKQFARNSFIDDLQP